MSQLRLTEEQYAPIQSSSRKIIVKALAGSGKSTLLRAYAFFYPDQKILYLVFNSDNSIAAKNSFPKQNTKVYTFHSYAYEAIGHLYQKANKIRPITPKSIKDNIGVNDWKLATVIRDVINKYVYSASLEITGEHFPRDVGSFYSRQQAQIINLARECWDKITDLKSSMPCSHDAYLKIWANTKPILPFDTIMIDEAQDANELMLFIIKLQQSKIILVGDRNQQIYAFRGSVNILDNAFLRDAEVFPLSQSFRFGIAIAKVANIILSMSYETMRVKGLESIQSRVMNKDDDELGHHGKPYQKAYISRTVSSTIEKALALVSHNKKTYWGGKISSYNLDGLLDLYYLSSGETANIKNPYFLKDYSSFPNYKEIADQTFDVEMMRNAKIIEQYGALLPGHVESLKRSATEHQSEADFIVTTAHRSKGLEFECVTLSDDFTNPISYLAKSLRDNKQVTEEAKRAYLSEMFLLYVAATRAIYRLNINTTISEIINEAKRRSLAKG